MDGGAWWAAVHGVAKSWTRLSGLHFTPEPDLAWIPGCGCTGPPAGPAPASRVRYELRNRSRLPPLGGEQRVCVKGRV